MSKRGEGLDGEAHGGLPVSMNPAFHNQTKTRNQRGEEQVCVIYFHAGAQRERAVFENHESPSAFPERGLKKNYKGKKSGFSPNGMCWSFMKILKFT